MRGMGFRLDSGGGNVKYISHAIWADNIVLFTDLSPAAVKASEVTPDDLHRVFYVGVTRTKQNLYLVEPEDMNRSYWI